jgi:hypothetical protein
MRAGHRRQLRDLAVLPADVGAGGHAGRDAAAGTADAPSSAIIGRARMPRASAELLLERRHDLFRGWHRRRRKARTTLPLRSIRTGGFSGCRRGCREPSPPVRNA